MREAVLGRPSSESQREITELQTRLNSELVQQQALMRRLDIPECLPQG